MTQRLKKQLSQIIYIQDKRRQMKLKKNKAWELNHLLVSSLPTLAYLVTYKWKGQVLPQSGKDLPTTAGISCVFLSHHGGDPTWELNLPPQSLLFLPYICRTISFYLLLLLKAFSGFRSSLFCFQEVIYPYLQNIIIWSSRFLSYYGRR